MSATFINMPPGDRRSPISTYKEGIQPAPLPAFIFHPKVHSNLLLQPLSAPAWCTDTKHSSRHVTGTDKTSSPPRLCDRQPLEEKPGGFNMQKGCKNKGQRKAAFPLREPQGSGSVLLPSLPYPHRPWAGQAGPGWQPSISCCIPDIPSLERKLFLNPFPPSQGKSLSHLVTISLCHGPHQ